VAHHHPIITVVQVKLDCAGALLVSGTTLPYLRVAAGMEYRDNSHAGRFFAVEDAVRKALHHSLAHVTENCGMDPRHARDSIKDPLDLLGKGIA